MARYIDADKLFRYVDEQTRISKGKLQNYIRENHTTDVAEVVRCEDCNFYIKSKQFEKDWCNKHAMNVKPTDFCSCGERRY